MMDAELCRLNLRLTREFCGVLDTLLLAREMHPGARNSLDELCKRYDVDNSQRELHVALLDAQILAEVYLMMTGGQTALALPDEEQAEEVVEVDLGDLDLSTLELRVVKASADE